MLELLVYVCQNPSGGLTLQQAGALMVYLAELPPEHHEQIMSMGAAVAIFTVMERAQSSIEALVRMSEKPKAKKKKKKEEMGEN